MAKTLTIRHRAVADLVHSIEEFLRLLDAEMRKPSDAERGRRIARLTNALEMAKDGFVRFELGVRK